MAITFVCSSARQTAFSLHPQTLAGTTSYLLQVSYVLGLLDKAGAWHDVLYEGAPQQVAIVVAPGAPLPTAQQIAARIKADAQATFGGTLIGVLIDGQSY